MSLFMKIGNVLNKAILTSPLHGIASKSILLISVTGRKSGQTYTTPVNYALDGNLVRITSGANRTWWRNLKANPKVELQLRGKAVQGTARVFEEPEAIAKELAAYLTSFPKAANYFGVRTEEDGSFNAEDLQRSSYGRVMIQVKVEG